MFFCHLHLNTIVAPKIDPDKVTRQNIDVLNVKNLPLGRTNSALWIAIKEASGIFLYEQDRCVIACLLNAFVFARVCIHARAY